MYYKPPLSEFGEKLDRYNKTHGRTVIRFDEYFCKNILERFAGFHGIRVADRPDLRCDAGGRHIGIEVVSSSSEEYNQLWRFVDYRDGILYVPKGLHDGARKVVEKFFPSVPGDGGARDFNLGQLDVMLSRPVVVKEIMDAFDRKFDKLKEYKKSEDCGSLDEYDLFIWCRSNVMFSDGDLNYMAGYFAEKGGYSTVFVFDDCALYIISGGEYRYVWCMDDVECISDGTVREILSTIDVSE